MLLLCCLSFGNTFSLEQLFIQMNGQLIVEFGTLPNVQQYDTVNHSVEFISPTGVHTQNVESYWNRVKTKLKRMKGCHEHQLSSYLDEFMYRERHGCTATQCFSSIIRDIATQYPV